MRQRVTLAAGLAPAKGKDQTLFSVSIERVNVSVREEATNKVAQDLFKFFEREFFVHQIIKVARM